MTNIATKDGAVIVKNGLVGESCGCCEDGACCEGQTCSVTKQAQCQGPGQSFLGVGTTCSPNPCVACYSCASPHPSYLNVTFTQTAPISGGYHESLIDLSGTYSIPSGGTTSTGCVFRAVFVKQYDNAILTNPPNLQTLYVSFRIDAIFLDSSKKVGIVIAGALLDANNVTDRGPGKYAITVATGNPLPLTGISMIGGTYNEILTPDQFVDFETCEDSVAASRQAYSMSGYQITYTNTPVQCGTFSWSSS